MDSPDLPADLPVGFAGAPECRFALAVEWWLFDPPVEEAAGLASVCPFACSPEWPLAFSPEEPRDCDFVDDFSGRAGGSGFGEAVDGAGDSVVGACSPAGSGAGVVAGGDCPCPAGTCPAGGT